MRNSKNTKERSEPGLLAGLDRSMEPLQRALAMQRRCAQVGFDWNDPSGARAKVAEELGELDEAVASGDPIQIRAEVGDLILAATNLARLLGVDPSEALQTALDRFQQRFTFVERHVARMGKAIQDTPLEELESYWQMAKKELSTTQGS